MRTVSFRLRQNPARLAIYFASLTLLDPLAASLLWYRRTIGLYLGILVLVTDVAANGYAVGCTSFRRQGQRNAVLPRAEYTLRFDGTTWHSEPGPQPQPVETDADLTVDTRHDEWATFLMTAPADRMPMPA